MATRRDQLHSYQFMTQRVISAFVMRETDPAQSPLRRGIGALFGGIMVAVLIAAGFGIYGILTRVGTDQWKSDGSVVVERESGASFVFLAGRLHPTLNVTSAKLAAGRPNPQVFRIAAKSLAEVPRGVTVGIPGAPTSLPVSGKRVGLPWTACAVPGAATGSAGGRVVLLVGAGAPAGAAGVGDRGLLVRDPSEGLTYLLWHGRRHLIQESRETVPALFGAVTPTSVGTAWLNALPAGADISTIRLADRGSPSPGVPNRKIGDILIAKIANGDQAYLVFADGLAPITPLQRAVLTARWPAPPIPIAISEATSVPTTTRFSPPTGDAQPPAAVPQLATAATGDPLCATTTAAAAPPALSTGGSPDAFAGAVPTAAATATGQALADDVLVPAGAVAIVRVPGSGGYTVITDLGIRHAVPNADALGALGYAPAMATAVPTALVSRLPAGVTLDPAAATQPAGSG